MFDVTITDPFFAGLCENNDRDERAMDCVRFIHATYGDSLSVADMEDAFERYGVEYCMLPRHLKAEFDYFDVF